MTNLHHTSYARRPFNSKAKNAAPAMIYQKMRARAEFVGKNMPVELMSIPVPSILPIIDASMLGKSFPSEQWTTS